MSGTDAHPRSDMHPGGRPGRAGSTPFAGAWMSDARPENNPRNNPMQRRSARLVAARSTALEKIFAE
jgi:hypothetical protein